MTEKTLRISVRNLVEFLLRSGDLDNRRSGRRDAEAMQAGSRLHRKIQGRMKYGYQPEVTLKKSVELGGIPVSVEGRADGIWQDEGVSTIDEIKGTYGDVGRMTDAVPVHLAQAKCYAYIYAVQHDLEEMGVQPPAFTRICRDLGKALPDGSWPVTEDEAAGLLRGMRIRPLLQERIPGQPARKTGQGKGQAAALETPGTEPLFKIRQLGFSYTPGVPILDGLNLELDARPTAVIGQNGAGKTTLVKLLKGLLRPVSGTIFFGQEDTSQKTVAMLAGKIGYVFQNPDDQIFKYNVLDEVMFGPQNIGMSPEKAKAEARKALETVGLWDKAGENPYDLELGERKMVAIASVLAMDTDVVILDEPTIAQDFAGRSVIAGAIRELKKRGKLVLAILHDMDFVAECFERVIVMAHGAILADGDAGTVFAMDDVLQKARLQKPSVARLCRRLSGETGELRVCLTVEEFLQRNGGTDLLEKP